MWLGTSCVGVGQLYPRPLIYGGAPHGVTHDDLIAIGTRGSRRLVPAPGRPVLRYLGEERP